MEASNTPPTEIDRNELLQLIVAQLQYYDFSNIARVVAKTTGLPDYSFEPSSRLAEWVALGKSMEAKQICQSPSSSESKTMEKESLSCGNTLSEFLQDLSSDPILGQSSAFEEETETRPIPKYLPGYSNFHKSLVSSATFSFDGRFVATASHDNNIRVLDVETLDDMLHGRTKTAAELKEKDLEEGPIARSLYDNSGTLHEIAFHPSNLVLASCSEDNTIRFYDVTRSSSRRSFRYLQDTCPVTTISFHPGGQFLIAGTTHPQLRLYDVHTFKCFTSRESAHPKISVVRASPDGKLIASTGTDGHIRIWDAINSSCIATFPSAHHGESVTGLTWSKQSRTLLSTGKDHTVLLWEVSSGRKLKAYYGATHDQGNVKAVFDWNEVHVISTDETTSAMVFWDTLTGEISAKLDSLHTGIVRIASSTEAPALLTYGDDTKFRYWGVSETEDSI
ncbi:hypothetical protein HMI54_000485 [Coelomomyces lativittatus]|nr:hypothetical protein HMI56_003282 [Coelomomyces lativittatus]KAJ1504300.1 hypothetical protein HMI55_002085 [Coelomomyces lativittatus]KAJ1511818.1 hypothetical protein HMI54_000485 [Coelomomyces lativittatus]